MTYSKRCLFDFVRPMRGLIPVMSQWRIKSFFQRGSKSKRGAPTTTRGAKIWRLLLGKAYLYDLPSLGTISGSATEIKPK